MKLVIHTDGGVSGGNKEDQPCYCAYVAHRVYSDGAAFHHSSKSKVDKGTSNQAEYRGILLALHDLDVILAPCGAIIEEIEFRSDSKIMVNQVNGTYKTKDAKLAILKNEVVDLISKIPCKVKVTHVRREHNPITDLLCNLAKKEIIKDDSIQTLTSFKQQHKLDKYKALKGV